MKTLKKIVYWWMVVRFFIKTKKNHLEAITGIENLPESGPFIVVANHSSFVDHYLIGGLFKSLYNKSVYFLTKKESFENGWSKFWHEASYAIPVNRDKPDIQAFKMMMDVLRKKNILVIYPEGTRGPGDQLLPFKIGAFKIASKMKVPVVPIGLVDAHKVMPKGQEHFNSDKASINIGETISVDFIKSHTHPEILEYTKETIFDLSLGKRKPNEDHSKILFTTNTLIKKVENRIEEVLEKGDYKAIKIDFKKYMEAIDYALINIPNHIPSLIQKARLIGIKALVSKADFLLNIGKVKRLSKMVLKRSKNHAFANYILGQYYLKMPILLGGNRKQALSCLSIAFQNAPIYGIAQSKFTLTLAEAYEKTGARGDALQLLRAAERAHGEGIRFQNRQLRIKQGIKRLSKSHS